MKQVWHIVRKDLRRMALPAALWCMLVAARAVLPSLAMGRAPADATVFSFWDAMLTLLQAMEICVECLLVAALVQEDNVTGTTAWWMTRPISGGQLLVAKGIGGGLLVAVAPAMVLSVVWMVMGFSAHELTSAVVWCVVVHGLIAGMALGPAAVAENLVQFLFGSLLLAAAMTPVVSYAEFESFLMLSPPPPMVRASAREWMACVVLLWPVVLAANQFLTRRRATTAVLLGAGLAVIFGFRLGWSGTSRPLTRLGLWTESTAAVERAEDKAVAVELTRVDATEVDNLARLTLRVTAPAEVWGSVFHLWSVRGAWLRKGLPDEASVYNRQAEAVARPEESVVRALAGLPSERGAVEWGVSREVPTKADDGPRGRPEGFRGEVKLRPMRGRVLGELALRPGTELRTGSSFTRVVGFEHVGEKTFAIIEERDALPMREYWLDDGHLRGRPEEVEDSYLLLDRVGQRAQLLGPGECDGLRAGAMVTGQRRLEVPDWAEGATLVKVLFEGDHVLVRPLVVERLPAESEGKLP